MGIYRNFPYSNFHELNMDEILKIVNDLSEQWKEYTAMWASGIDTESLVTPEMYGAVGDGATDDSVAFQAMIDDLSRYGGTAVLKKSYVLDNSIIIKRDSNEDNPISIIGLGKESTLICRQPFKGQLFNYGNIKFFNVHFTGNRAFAADHTLIRVFCLSCTFEDMESVVFATHIVQSYYFINCIVRHCEYLVDGRATTTSSYDVKISECLIEHGGYCFYYPNANSYALMITNNCIEGMDGTVATLQTSRTAVISNNYFEKNAGSNSGAALPIAYIELTVNNTGSVIVENNNIVEPNAKILVQLPANVVYPAAVRIVNNNVTDPTTPFEFLSTLDPTRTYTGLIYRGNNKLPSDGRITREPSSIEVNESAPFELTTPIASYPDISDVLVEVASYAKDNYRKRAIWTAVWDTANFRILNGLVFINTAVNRIFVVVFDNTQYRIGVQSFVYSTLNPAGAYHSVLLQI